MHFIDMQTLNPTELPMTMLNAKTKMFPVYLVSKHATSAFHINYFIIQNPLVIEARPVGT